MNIIHSIYLVDDDLFSHRINERIFKSVDPDLSIQVFSSGIEALRQLQNLDQGNYGARAFPDLILLDIEMPHMNGFQFLDEFRKLEVSKTSWVKIHILSSSNDPSHLALALEHPACSGYLTKPLTVQKVREYFFSKKRVMEGI